MDDNEKKELKNWVYSWFPKQSNIPSREYYAIQELVIAKILELAENLTVENDNLNATLNTTREALKVVIDKILDNV